VHHVQCHNKSVMDDMLELVIALKSLKVLLMKSEVQVT